MSDITRIRWDEPWNRPSEHRCPKGHYSRLIHGVVICDECGTSTTTSQGAQEPRLAVEIVSEGEVQGVRIVAKERLR